MSKRNKKCNESGVSFKKFAHDTSSAVWHGIPLEYGQYWCEKHARECRKAGYTYAEFEVAMKTTYSGLLECDVIERVPSDAMLEEAWNAS